MLGQPFRIGFGGRMVFQYAPDVARAFILASRSGLDGARAYNLPGTLASIDDLIDRIDRHVPGAARLISHDPEPLPFPEEIDASGVRELGDMPGHAARRRDRPERSRCTATSWPADASPQPSTVWRHEGLGRIAVRSRRAIAAARCGRSLLLPPVGALAGPIERVEPASPRVVDQVTRKVPSASPPRTGEKVRKLKAFTATLGGRRRPSGSIWSRWGDKANRAFPTELARKVDDLGVTPMIWWEPVNPGSSKPWFPRYTNIDRRAPTTRTSAASPSVPASTAGPCSCATRRSRTARTTRGRPGGTGTLPRAFVAAWQHIWSIFVDEEATNVKFVWSVSKRGVRRRLQPVPPVLPG